MRCVRSFYAQVREASPAPSTDICHSLEPGHWLCIKVHQRTSSGAANSRHCGTEQGLPTWVCASQCKTVAAWADTQQTTPAATAELHGPDGLPSTKRQQQLCLQPRKEPSMTQLLPPELLATFFVLKIIALFQDSISRFILPAVC